MIFFEKLPKKNKTYNREIKFHERFGHWAVTFSIRGEKHAAHFHCAQYRFEGKIQYNSGMEMHWSSPPDYMANTPPHHEKCPFLLGPCWHDGTSLGAVRAESAFLSSDYQTVFMELENFIRDKPEEMVEEA